MTLYQQEQPNRQPRSGKSHRLTMDHVAPELREKIDDLHVRCDEQTIVELDIVLRSCISKHLSKMGRKQHWIGPLGIFITFVITFVTTILKTGQDMSTAELIWLVLIGDVGLLCAAWVVWCIVQAIRTKPPDKVVDDIVNEVKRTKKPQTDR